MVNGARDDDDDDEHDHDGGGHSRAPAPTMIGAIIIAIIGTDDDDHRARLSPCPGRGFGGVASSFPRGGGDLPNHNFATI